MKKRLRLCLDLLRLWLYLLVHAWTFGLEEICGGAMLRAPQAAFPAVWSGETVSCRFFGGCYERFPWGGKGGAKARMADGGWRQMAKKKHRTANIERPTSNLGTLGYGKVI